MNMTRIDSADPQPAMRFTGWQLLAIASMDVILKSIYFFVFSLNLFALPIAVFYTGIHLSSFVLARAFVNLFPISRRIAFITILISTNILFVAVSTLLRVYWVKSGKLTECFGVARVCYWIDGEITAEGLRIMAIRTSIYISLNIISFLITVPFFRRTAPLTAK